MFIEQNYLDASELSFQNREADKGSIMKSPCEFLKSVPAKTQLTCAHVLGIVSSMKPGIAQEQIYSPWDPEQKMDEASLTQCMGASVFKSKGEKSNKIIFSGDVLAWVDSQNTFKDFPDTFPVFVYKDGPSLDLETSVAVREEPATFFVVGMTQWNQELSRSLIPDRAKAKKLLSEDKLSEFSLPYWFFSQALTGVKDSQPFIQAVAMLQDHGVDINSADPKSGMTLAHVLVWTERNFTNHTQLLSTLLDMGLDVEAPDREGMTAVNLAELENDECQFLEVITKRDFKSNLETILTRD